MGSSKSVSTIPPGNPNWTPLRWRLSATRANASCAATASGCAKKCKISARSILPIAAPKCASAPLLTNRSPIRNVSAAVNARRYVRQGPSWSGMIPRSFGRISAIPTPRWSSRLRRRFAWASVMNWGCRKAKMSWEKSWRRCVELGSTKYSTRLPARI